MDTSKIIKGVVGGGRYTVTASITQWDYGYIFLPEIEDLPATYRLDFSNEEHHGTALPVYGNSEGAEVPETLIDTGKDIFVWYFYIGDGYGKSVYKWRIPNKCKPKTSEDEPTPSQQSSIDQLISVANEAIDTAQESASQASASAQSAGQSAISADESAQSAQQSLTALTEYGNQAIQELLRIADDVNTSATNASDSAEASAQSAQSAEQSAQTATEKADSITGLTAQATTLPSGSSATASYSNGTLTLGIPRGADGTDGEDGEDGISPTVTITPITGGHRITITDADGEHSADVMDGTGSVEDVQINGTSIVTDGVANVPVASTSEFGVVKTDANLGITINTTGKLVINRSSTSQNKLGTDSARPIVPFNQHESVFYGLAKSAGDTTQSASSNAVGNYTDEAKTAIQKMLGIYQAPWELIKEEIFTNAEEADLVISTDANGEGFELTDAFIIFLTPRQDTVAKVGNYGQTIFNLSNNDFVITESGQWENAANATGKGFAAQAKVDGNLITSMSTQAQSASSPSAWRSRWNITNGFRFYNNVSITSVTIRAITGTAKYTLYGRRKWQ